MAIAEILFADMRHLYVGSALASIGLAMFLRYLAKPHKMDLTEAAFRVKCGHQTTGGFDSSLAASNFHPTDVSVGCVKTQMQLTEELSNFLGTLHGGVSALLVDVIGTYAIMAGGLFPGVTTDISVDYTAAAPIGSTVIGEGKLLKGGRNLAWCEVTLTTPEGKLLAKGRMTKFVGGRLASVYYIVMNLPNWIRCPLSARAISTTPSAQRTACPKSTLPVTEEGKTEYFRHFALCQPEDFAFIGFDRMFTGEGLRRVVEEEKLPGNVKFDIKVGPLLTNYLNAFHGAAAAAMIDDIGTAALVDYGCPPGASVNLSVSYFSGAPARAKLIAESRILRGGQTLGFVEVEIRCQRTNRLYYKGSLTKYGKGASTGSTKK
ncbi:hypothetical protein CYMTET_30059 [Cymbomonas tetramitiformis]|uniref:Thioesterase domain-containing protein n=1 Tax=Cymbomonas tetramitiformis TaxID=36881 RepID=A0AAE0FK28_9CHLO|nr:hypothetical protein CYMTET_30059 [Cymbomonas tetramitiformis]